MKIEKMIVASLILIAVSIVFFYLFYNKYNETEEDMAQLKPDFRLSAEQLVNAFHSNETTANKQYLDKVIEVKGSVQEVTHNGKDIVIVLKGNSDFENVSCTLQHDAAISTDALVLGTSLTIRGKCTGFLMDVTMVHSLITNQ